MDLQTATPPAPVGLTPAQAQQIGAPSAKTSRAPASAAQGKSAVYRDAVQTHDQLASQDCEHILNEHTKWLMPLAGGFKTIESVRAVLNTHAPGEIKRRGAEPLLTADIRVTTDEKMPIHPPNFKIYETDHEQNGTIARSWEEYRKTVGFKEGQRFVGSSLDGPCDLKKANLALANVTGLSEPSSFDGATMAFSTLRAGLFYDTSFIGSNLMGADLEDATFTHSDFNGADLSAAWLVSTTFSNGTSLKGTNLSYANLSGAFFEPGDVTDLTLFKTEGLDKITFADPKAIVTLRKAMRDNGQTTEARALTAAIFRQNLLSEPIYSRVFDDYIRGGRLTRYGVTPWAPLLLLIALIPIFAVPYAISLFSTRSSGIYVLHFVDGVAEKRQRQSPVRLPRFRVGGIRQNLVSFMGRVSFLFRVPLYFSLLSAFEIGYHDINISGWILRMQPRPYSLKARGWVRTVAGVQSFVSLYLLALWILTLFGNPFEV